METPKELAEAAKKELKENPGVAKEALQMVKEAKAVKSRCWLVNLLDLIKS